MDNKAQGQDEEGKLDRDWVKGNGTSWGDRFKKLLKFLAYSLVLIITLALVWIAVSEFLDSKYYKKLTYEHPTSLRGIQIGDLKKDVIFKLGKPDECLREDDLSTSVEYVTSEQQRCRWDDNSFSVGFAKDGSAYLLREGKHLDGYPASIELLQFILGEPQIFSSSKDLLTRRYTYSRDGLKTGDTYTFSDKGSVSLMMEEIAWRSDSDNPSKYYIYGEQYCPGDDCPFDEKGKRKKAWKDKTVRGFVDAMQNKE